MYKIYRQTLYNCTRFKTPDTDDWKKLDPKSEECKNLVTQYWKWEGTDLEGCKFNQGKILK